MMMMTTECSVKIDIHLEGNHGLRRPRGIGGVGRVGDVPQCLFTDRCHGQGSKACM